MRVCFSAILLFSIFFLPASVQGAEIRLIAANAVKEPLIELFQAFEKASGHTVVALWAGTEAATKRVASGEVVDVVVIAAPNIERLIADGKLAAGSRTDFAKSGVGVAVRDGLPKPDISSVAALKEALLAAKSIAYSQGPSGAYIARLIEKLGIAEQIKDKVHQTPSGVQVARIRCKRRRRSRFPADFRTRARQRHSLPRAAAFRGAEHHNLYGSAARIGTRC
jgi:ABC-type molybdate transport system substrate-binding protein